MADRRPDKTEDCADKDNQEGSDDRHRAFAGEETEIGREVYFVEAIETPGRDQADDDTAEHTRFDRGNAHDWFDLDALQLCADAHRREKNNVTRRARQRGYAVVFGQSNGDTDGEEQCI